jgi:nicotinamide mononucleotide transporter
MEFLASTLGDWLLSQFTDIDFWDAIQILGLLLSFLYLYLEFEQKAMMWIISAMCSMIYASVYFHSKIYADMGFSIFNIMMCSYGFYKWWTSSKKNIADKTKDNKNKQIEYYHFTLPQFGRVMVVFILIWAGIFFMLKNLTDSPIPALDALTTTLNIVGTWVLAQKIIEVWGFWFLVNIISIYIYCKRGLHISTILLYGFYLGASVYGYFKWKRQGLLADHQ